MSTATEIPEAVIMARRLIKLSKEFANRLNAYKGQAYDLLDPKMDPHRRNIQVRDLWGYAANVRPAAEQLIRQASQFVEHGAVDGATRIELRLRLAELEHALASMTAAVQALPR